MSEDIKKLVDELKDLKAEEEIAGKVVDGKLQQEGKLQEILKTLLTETELRFSTNGGKTVYVKPLEIEAYYYNESKNFKDECVHVHKLQKNRQGKVYIHRYKSNAGESKALRAANRAGMDLVLSDSDGYAFAVLIRSAEIGFENQLEEISGPANLVKKLFKKLNLDYKTIAQSLKNDEAEILVEEKVPCIHGIEDKNVLFECEETDKEKSEVVFSPRINIYRGKKDLPLRANLKNI